jgi:hypothetical protein
MTDEPDATGCTLTWWGHAAVVITLDGEFARLERASAGNERPYEFVVLSDHGQGQGATFRTRYGQSLADVVQDAIGAPTTPAARDQSAAGEEAWGYAGVALKEIGAGPGMAGRVVSSAANRHREPRRRRATGTRGRSHGAGATAETQGLSRPSGAPRTDAYTHCPEIMLNSSWDAQTGEVAAFEELVGSHGGLGGEQRHG